MDFTKKFSHIYIEDCIKKHTKTKKILNYFPNAEIIIIPHYKEIFNRSGQDYRLLKKSQKLILAKRQKNFLYKTSFFIQNFGWDNIFYTPHVYNCVYDCSYCYLQGMFSNPNMVIFVNIEDYFATIKDQLKQIQKPIYICISYNSDLLALEHYTSFIKEWLYFTHNEKKLIVENRSKSVNYKYIKCQNPPQNFILSWSLLPDSLTKMLDLKTPKLKQRLRVIHEALNDGFKVRLSFEPVIFVKNYEQLYSEFLEEVFTYIDASKIQDLNIDLFRINSQYLKNIQKIRQDKILYYPYVQQDKMSFYNTCQAKLLFDFFQNNLKQYINMKKVFMPKNFTYNP